MLKLILARKIRKSLRRWGVDLVPIPKVGAIPDAEFYAPLFSPWRGYGEFRDYYRAAESSTLVSEERCYVLYTLAQQALALDGEFWECGVFKGGTALLLARLLAEKGNGRAVTLRLFDTFSGMPETDAEKDRHRQGDFMDTSLTAVQKRVGHAEVVKFHPGFIPQTFAGMEASRIAWAHVDVDIYQTVRDCCAFIYPRLLPGGFMIFDDYGFPSCPGARQAVDEFFRTKPETPWVLPTGQAVVIALPQKEVGKTRDVL
jgi:O-methyltransferase